jgi:hypothetical protein
MADGRGRVRGAAGRAKPAPVAPIDGTDAADVELPPGCPVTPIGVDGDTRYYLNSKRQMRALLDEKHGRLSLMGMFDGHEPWLFANYPRHDKDGAITGWRPESVAAHLMRATGHAGIWNSDERERGRGAWLGDDGELVIHTGQHVLVFPPTAAELHRAPANQEPGLIGRYVYPADSEAGTPAEPRAPGLPGAAEEVLTLLTTWQWRRKNTDDSDVELDAILLLGWVGAAMIGGALPWRPTVWFTGASGTGKSTLHRVLHSLFGEARVQTSNATGASLWQTLKHQTLPVIFEELEARNDNRRAEDVIELARLAPSGGKLKRGTDKHKAVEFTIRSCFAFSSILMPPLKEQDRSRITVLELDALPEGTPEPVIDTRRLRVLGGLLRRRMIDGWPRFARTYAWYRQALQDTGHRARGAEQFASLLASADLLLFDNEVDPQMAAAWIARAGVDALGETSEELRDPDACLKWILESHVDAGRGAKRELADYIHIAIGTITGDAADARRTLGMFGLAVWTELETNRRYLAVANQHRGLAPLFDNTHWQAYGGTIGVWVQTLRRLPGARKGPSIYMGGGSSRTTIIPLALIPKPERPAELPLDRSA